MRLVALLALLGACRPAVPSTVVRVVDGEPREGAFVSPYAYEHFLRAELAAARGDDASAAESYELARLGPSDDALVAARQAEALDRLGRIERADAVLAEADALDPRSEAVALARSRIAERRGDPELALREAVRASELAPGSTEAWRRVATLLVDTERATEVLARLGDDALALRARLAIAIARGDAREAEAALEALSRVTPVGRDELARTIELALAEGRVMLASHLAERLAEGPDGGVASAGSAAGVAALRARAWLAAGRNVEAEGVLSLGAPEAFGGPRAMAELWLDAGRPDRAAELAREALSLGDARARVVLAEALVALGEPVEAAEEAARVPPEATDRDDAWAVLRAALADAGAAGLAAELGARVDTAAVESRARP
jgi:tetratricopeptide (TPR) repeat protein